VEKNEPDEVCVTRNSSGSNPSPGQIGKGAGELKNSKPHSRPALINP